MSLCGIHRECWIRPGRCDLAAGPGRTLDNGSREEIEVAVGQKVLFQKYAGTEFKLDEDELLILKHADILAIVE